MIEMLSKTCSVCSREKKKKDAILYASDGLQPYCATPYMCGDKENHPNYPLAIAKRGNVFPLITAEEAKQRMNTVLREKYADPAMMDRVSKLLTQPSTIRISEVEHAEFIISLMDEYNFKTKTDVFRFCIEEAMRSYKRLHQAEAELYNDGFPSPPVDPIPAVAIESLIDPTLEIEEQLEEQEEEIEEVIEETKEEEKKEVVVSGEWDF